MECLASLGDCGVSHRGNHNRLYGRPQRVFVLAVLAKNDRNFGIDIKRLCPLCCVKESIPAPLAWDCVFNPFTHAVRTASLSRFAARSIGCHSLSPSGARSFSWLARSTLMILAWTPHAYAHIWDASLDWAYDKSPR